MQAGSCAGAGNMQAQNMGQAGNGSTPAPANAAAAGAGSDSSHSSSDSGSDSSDEGSMQNMGQANSPGPCVASSGPSEATSQPPSLSKGPTTCWFLAQECSEVDLLNQGGGGGDAGGLTPSALYTAAFSIFNENSFAPSVGSLLGEFNDRSTIQCARDFTDFNGTTVQATQADGSGMIDFFFPAAQAAGEPRTLNDATVDFTLPNLGSYGDLRLRFMYDPSGNLQSTERFFRPPNQGNDQFFPFPLTQTVSTI